MIFELFKSTIMMSALGAAVFIVMTAAKPFTRKIFGSRWQYYSWIVVLAALVFPIRLVIPHNARRSPAAYVSAPTAAAATLVPEQAASAPTPIPAPTPTPAMRYVSDVPIEYKTVTMRGNDVRFTDIIAAAWLAGAAVYLMSGLISYAIFLRGMKKNSYLTECAELEEMRRDMGIRCKIRVRSTPMIDAPLMTGLIRPTLLMPDRELDSRTVYYILRHELTHYRRHDLWYKWAAMLVTSVHWFNPAAHLVTREINRECEISCDIEATRGMSDEEKKEYMNTILSVVSD